MSGYTRQSAADIIATATVKAAPINAEYNKLRDAFTFDSAGTTGHKHDGSSDEGSYVPLIADLDGLNKVVVDTSNNRVGVFVEVSSSAVEQVRFQDGAIVPVTTNDIDLGTASLEFKNAYFDGVVTSDSFAGPLTGDVTGNITSTGTSTFTTVDINGGNIDSTIIGAATPAAITGTTITANTGFVGNVTGNVTGNLTGNVTGDLTGNVTGNVTGDVTGDLTGNVTGNLTGNITGDVTGDLTGNVTGNITSSGSSAFSGTITVPTPSTSTQAATKGYVDSVVGFTTADYNITQSGTDLNFSYLGTTIATMDSSGGLDVDSLAINGTAFSITKATLDKSFRTNEEYNLTLSPAITSGVPVVSVLKEVPSTTNQTDNTWDVATNGSNYDRYSIAPNSTLTPSSTTGTGTFTLGSGSSIYDYAGGFVEGNGGVAQITDAAGGYTVITPFNDTSTIAAGDWVIYGVNFDATNGIELGGYLLGGGFVPVPDYWPSITNVSGQIDSSLWVDINSMTSTEVPGDGEIYYAVSNDNRTTWRVIDNSSGERDIVRNNAGTWQYNSNATYTNTTWTNGTTNEELATLQQALGVVANRMDKTQLEAASDPNQFTIGSTLDLMIALSQASYGTLGLPTSDGVSINYDSNGEYQLAVPGTDYTWAFPNSTTVALTSLGQYNLKVRAV